MSEFINKTELLSPAGSFDALCAAIAAGADAVYLGGGDFNARAGAKNFTLSELEKAIYIAHENGVKIYITLNTLLGDREIPAAAEFAHRLHVMGADAFIVQDFGTAKYLKECIPDINLHASTQTAAHNADAANFFARHGFSRVVIAREVSREDLKILMRETPVEIEMFVHGAICVCQSGQCLMSSFIGGRSGNRGECAQPCRLSYRAPAGYPLSLKDMCLAEFIPEIMDLGISSLKIEGRMKSPEYVYGVTSVYRRLLDEHRKADKSELTYLKNLFSRGGFTSGYFTQNKKDMFAVRSDADKAATVKAEKQLSPTVTRALSSLKALKLPEKSCEIPSFAPPRAPKTAHGMKKPKKAAALGIRVVFAHGAEYSEKLIDKIRSLDYGDKYLEGIYLTLDDKLFRADGFCGIVTPSIVLDREKADFDKLLQHGAKQGYKKCLIRNVSHIPRVENADYSLHGGAELNVYNSESVKAWREYGLSSVTLSPECLTAQIRDIDKYKIPCGVTVYGRIPLMTTETCHIGDCAACKKGCRRRNVLVDRTGARFPIFADGTGRNIIYNSLPLCAADKLNTLYEYGVSFVTLSFTDETEKQVVDILKSFIRGENPDCKFTRGYLK